GVGEESTRRRRSRSAGDEFLEEQLIADLVERRERATAKVNPHVTELVVEAAQNIEDEGAIVDDLAEVPELGRHGLHLAAVVADGQLTLREGAELGVKAQRSSFAVAQELRLDAKPRLASSAAADADGVHDL